MLLQVVQVFGSALILAAFVAAQQGRLSMQSTAYLSLNLAGAAVLAVLAAHERQLGFLLLESVWALVAARSLLSRPGAAGPSGARRSAGPVRRSTRRR